MKRSLGMCPVCGRSIAMRKVGLVRQHCPPLSGVICEGTGQIPRDPQSDRRPLWPAESENQEGSVYRSELNVLDLMTRRDQDASWSAPGVALALGISDDYAQHLLLELTRRGLVTRDRGVGYRWLYRLTRNRVSA